MMGERREVHVVTGAFGYTGKYIARRLLDQGRKVRTLTGHPNRPNPFGSSVSVESFDFEKPDRLAESLRGAAVLYNTYWIRFPHGKTTFDTTIENTKILIRACEQAGVERIVHVSITNPSEESPLPYFRGKAIVEKAIRSSRLSYAILRPTVIFGTEDILINNIAWFLRHFPVFGIMGRGDYRLRPVFVEDVADLAVNAGQREEDLVLDAVGPETYTFEDLVQLIAEKTRSRSKIVHLPPQLSLLASKLAGRLVGDVILTRDEVRGLMGNLLVSSGPTTGSTRLSMWLEENAGTLGLNYAAELERHYR